MGLWEHGIDRLVLDPTLHRHWLLLLQLEDQENPNCNSYMAYTTSYADTGLLGVYFTADKNANLKLLVDAIQKEWGRLSRRHNR